VVPDHSRLHRHTYGDYVAVAIAGGALEVRSIGARLVIDEVYRASRIP
jgi:hypothetical protein